MATLVEQTFLVISSALFWSFTALSWKRSGEAEDFCGEKEWQSCSSLFYSFHFFFERLRIVPINLIATKFISLNSKSQKLQKLPKRMEITNANAKMVIHGLIRIPLMNDVTRVHFVFLTITMMSTSVNSDCTKSTQWSPVNLLQES